MLSFGKNISSRNVIVSSGFILCNTCSLHITFSTVLRLETEGAAIPRSPILQATNTAEVKSQHGNTQTIDGANIPLTLR